MGSTPEQNFAGRRRNTIFVVDHAADNLDRFKTLFGSLNHLVYYSTSPDDIRSIMEGVSPDIVICNLYMPGSSARDFLGYLKKKAPHAIRMVYSVESDLVELMRLLSCGIAHRYFCLPWEKNNLGELLLRDLATRNKIRTKKCWDFLEAESLLPVLPDVLREIDEILRDDNFSIERLVGVIEKDPVVSAKLLQIVNSSAFPKISAISDLQRAVTYLGIKQVREVVLFVCAREMFPPAKRCAEASVTVARQSFRCSKLAVVVAKTVAPGWEKEAATAALLHDIGKMLFFTAPFCDTYFSELGAQGTFNPFDPAWESDQEVFGISHTEIGCCLLLWWDMPLSIVATAAEHNVALAQLGGVSLSVAIARRCLAEAGQPGRVDVEIDKLPEEFPIEKWRSEARKIVGG